MSELAQDVEHVEELSEPTEETKQEVAPETDEVSQTEAEEVAEDADQQDEPSVEERLAEMEKQIKDHQRKNARQTAAYRQLQRRYEETIAEKQEVKTEGPNEEDFDTLEDYYKEKAKYDAEIIAEEKLKAAEDKKTQEAQAKVFAEQRRTFVAKEEALRQAAPDYDAAAEAMNEYLDLADKNDPAFKAFGEAMMSSDKGPELVYHLGKSPEKIEALFGKSPAMVYRMMAKYEQEADAPKPVKQTAKPKPPTPVKGKSVTKSDPAKMSTEEYVAWRNKQQFAK